MKTKTQIIAKYERKYSIGKSMITLTYNGDIYTICTYARCNMHGAKTESSVYSDYDNMIDANMAYKELVKRHIRTGAFGHNSKNGYNVYLTKQ